MPTTRRSAASARSRTGPTRGQSTISFSNKVTKDIPKSDKKKGDVGSPASLEISEVEEKASATEHDSPRATSRETDPCTQGSYAGEITREDDADAGTIGHAVRDLDISRSAASSPWEKAEVEADGVSDAQIKRYWGGVENQRRAPMVHLEGVDVWEKALRHFDVSSQYGPCIGISRSKRWRRAQRLGLDPPIEILAIIQKEEKLGHRDAQTAQMDRIMNATALATN